MRIIIIEKLLCPQQCEREDEKNPCRSYDCCERLFFRVNSYVLATSFKNQSGWFTFAVNQPLYGVKDDTDKLEFIFYV